MLREASETTLIPSNANFLDLQSLVRQDASSSLLPIDRRDGFFALITPIAIKKANRSTAAPTIGLCIEGTAAILSALKELRRSGAAA